MYHIKNDKRARASTELICAGLLACMKEKPFARITITDVQRASTVSRSTFYRNFDCLEDVLALLCDRGFQAVFSEYNALPPEQRGSRAKAVFQYWFRNSAVLEALVQIHRTDILFDSLRRRRAAFSASASSVIATFALCRAVRSRAAPCRVQIQPRRTALSGAGKPQGVIGLEALHGTSDELPPRF